MTIQVEEQNLESVKKTLIPGPVQVQGPITAHFMQFLSLNGYGGYDFARLDLGTIGSFGGKLSSQDEVVNRPIVFVHGNSDGALTDGSKYGTGWTSSITYFLGKGYTSAELYATTWGDRNKMFLEAVLQYTNAEKINVISHSMGVAVARKAIRGGNIEADDGNCELGPSLRGQVEAFIGISGANYGMCQCTGGNKTAIYPTCNKKNGFWPGEPCDLSAQVPPQDLCGSSSRACSRNSYSQLLQEMNEDPLNEAQHVFSFWSYADDLIAYHDSVFGRPTSFVPFSNASKVYETLDHMQTKDATPDVQHKLVTTFLSKRDLTGRFVPKMSTTFCWTELNAEIGNFFDDCFHEKFVSSWPIQTVKRKNVFFDVQCQQNLAKIVKNRPICSICATKTWNRQTLNRIRLYENCLEKKSKLYEFVLGVEQVKTTNMPNLENLPKTLSKLVSKINLGHNLAFVTDADLPVDSYALDDFLTRVNDEAKSKNCLVSVDYQEPREMALGEILELMKHLQNSGADQELFPLETAAENFESDILIKDKKRADELATLLAIFSDKLKQKIGEEIPDLNLGQRKLRTEMIHASNVFEDQIRRPQMKAELLPLGKKLLKVLCLLTEESVKSKVDGFLPDNLDFVVNALLRKLPTVDKLVFVSGFLMTEYEGNELELQKIPGFVLTEQNMAKLLPLVDKPRLRVFKLFLQRNQGEEPLCNLGDTFNKPCINKFLQYLQKLQKAEPLLAFAHDALRSQPFKIGFARVQDPKKRVQSKSDAFTAVCPQNCTGDLRLWICPKCCSFLTRTKDNLTVACDCGVSSTQSLQLQCTNPHHQDSQNDFLSDPLQQTV
uniref:Lipase n=1 Tax=Panagrolaimus sp. JU765 TaxID=591449 RepID=A0AC34QGC9_9BILA